MNVFPLHINSFKSSGIRFVGIVQYRMFQQNATISRHNDNIDNRQIDKI